MILFTASHTLVGVCKYKKKHDVNFISCVKKHADIVTLKICIFCIFCILSVFLALSQKLNVKMHTFFKCIYSIAYNT